ncbi:hypothetical protein ACFL35_13920 [Candidatus Riflebacteria bacterium]
MKIITVLLFLFLFQPSLYSENQKVLLSSSDKYFFAASLKLTDITGFYLSKDYLQTPLAVILKNIPLAKFSGSTSPQKACFANIRVMHGAIEMYNMDTSTMMKILDSSNLDKLLKKSYLKTIPLCPNKGEYTGSGLDADGIPQCSFHGTIGKPKAITLPDKEAISYSFLDLFLALAKDVGNSRISRMQIGVSIKGFFTFTFTITEKTRSNLLNERNVFFEKLFPLTLKLLKKTGLFRSIQSHFDSLSRKFSTLKAEGKKNYLTETVKRKFGMRVFIGDRVLKIRKYFFEPKPLKGSYLSGKILQKIFSAKKDKALGSCVITFDAFKKLTRAILSSLKMETLPARKFFLTKENFKVFEVLSKIKFLLFKFDRKGIRTTLNLYNAKDAEEVLIFFKNSSKQKGKNEVMSKALAALKIPQQNITDLGEKLTAANEIKKSKIKKKKIFLLYESDMSCTLGVLGSTLLAWTAGVSAAAMVSNAELFLRFPRKCEQTRHLICFSLFAYELEHARLNENISETLEKNGFASGKLKCPKGGKYSFKRDGDGDIETISCSKHKGG